MGELSSSKCVIVIAGIANDLFFCHACYVAENLTRLLPNFHLERISKSYLEWEEICTRRGWTHSKSPLIWREIGISSTRVTYIGGINQFWALLREYYNITSNLTRKELEKLKLDMLLTYETELNCPSLQKHGKHRIITIIGAGRSLCPDLVPQLITTKELWLSHGIIINLYDEPGYVFQVRRILKDMEAIGGGLRAVRAIKDIPDGLHNCDILLYLDALCRDEYEQTMSWLHRNYECMEKLCKQINQHAPTNMRIIFCSMGPTCFCANVMSTLLTKIPKTNIVTVSAHYGLEIVYNFVTSLGFSPKEFGCPPIWGFLGISRFVDVSHMVQKHDVYKPNKRALTAKENSSLPLGTKHPELRWFLYTSHDKNPYKHYLERKALTYYQVGRADDFQKCKAICDLLKLWYSKNEDVGDEIISLGICSDGTFGILEGLYFSQPVCLKKLEDNTRIWVPVADFPMPFMPLSIFRNLITTADSMIAPFKK